MAETQARIDIETATQKELVDFYLSNVSDSPCPVCRFSCDCDGGGVKGGPNGPIYPPCCDEDDYIELDDLRNEIKEFLEENK